MPKQLEDYLNEVAQTLGSLPKARRADEMREIRAHLLNAFAVNQEAGQLEEEAAQVAVEQFGEAPIVGAGIVTAWRRERKIDAFKIMGAAVVTPVLFISLLYLLGNVSMFLQGLFDNTFLLHHITIVTRLMFSFFYIVCGLTGAILGAIVPKQAVRSTILGMVLCECVRFALIGGKPFQPIHCVAYLVDLSLALTAVLGAWLVSRRRLGRQSRTSTSVS